MIGLQGKIRGGIDAGKLFEIMDKVGLIEVAAVGSHVRPRKLRASPNLLQYLLKAPDASKELGR